MKNTLIIFILLISFSAIARVVAPFVGWDNLIGVSPYIAIVHCCGPTPPDSSVMVVGAPRYDYEIQPICILKGKTNMNPARLWTDHELRPGENCLIFGYYDGRVYQAYEEYRVIPLGNNFSTNLIASKPLGGQLKILFKMRVEQLDRQMQAEQAEKERLKEYIN